LTTYDADDGQFTSSATVTITVTDLPPPPQFQAQTDFKIMMNYELGMHCTGFEFAYCCVLPVYNSILAQVVKPDATGQGFPELLEGDPNAGKDALGRETVVRDRERIGNNFKKYVVKYWHDAQPRNDGRGKAQLSTLISAVEGNSMMAWNTSFDSAEVVNGALQYGGYDGADGVVQGNGTLGEPADNYQNAIWNHLYFYSDLEGSNPGNTSLEANKIRLGVNGQVVYPPDCGAALHPLGPETQGGDPNNPVVANDCGGFSNGNVLTFSGSSGTVVYTQMKVLENLPVMLTSPDIWEALGLPLTPFEDSIDFFGDPGLVDEDSVRPFVAMKAQMYDYDPAAPSGAGAATLDGGGVPVIGFGTAPIDIPNCERCHSNPPDGSVIQNAANEGGGTLTVANSPNNDPALYALVQQEYNYWMAVYPGMATGSDWYARLKSAAISMLTAHDIQHGTGFAANYPGADVAGEPPQNTRLGHESVICQRCHADNVIAVVKSANCGTGNELGTDSCAAGTLIPPISEAIHLNHDNVANGGPIAFADSLGREGGCQGCHPAHRSNGDMAGYPITLAGTNKYANGDNRGASGGCFVGRDVHSNPGKDTDGAETPEHLNAVGQWLADNVSNSPTENTGIWCTNCHNQLGQEMWKTENMTDLVHGVGATNPRGEPTLAAVAAAVGTTTDQAIAWLDPKDNNPLGDFSHAIWASDPGLCNYVAGAFGVIPVDPAHDGNVATVEVNVTSAAACSTGGGTGLIDCGAQFPGAPAFHICGSTDADGDFSVSLLDFCTTADCVTAAQATLPAGSVAVPVPFSAATDGRDHWLSAGEPHCADCHAAPFTEQSGNINAYPPFNYPRKASLMRYSKGHQGITCQGCHESIHGLYPVTPNIDTTSYAQAAALNADGSHGPLKCGTCHAVNAQGIPSFMATNRAVYSVPGYGGAGINDYDEAVAWAHIYTDEQSVLATTCQNCHGVQGANWADVGPGNGTYLRHAMRNPPRGSRQMMDKAEIELFGAVLTTTPNGAGQLGTNGVCTGCHGNEGGSVSCTNNTWLNHLTQGRVSASVFEAVSLNRTGSTCW
jgi:cytochrome c553